MSNARSCAVVWNWGKPNSVRCGLEAGHRRVCRPRDCLNCNTVGEVHPCDDIGNDMSHLDRKGAHGFYRCSSCGIMMDGQHLRLLGRR